MNTTESSASKPSLVIESKPCLAELARQITSLPVGQPTLNPNIRQPVYPAKMLVADERDIRANIDELSLYGLPVAGLIAALDAALEDARAVPTLDDLRYVQVEPCSIDEHLRLQPTISTSMCVGRAYRLTAGQRAIIAQWYDLTPTETVVPTEIACYAGTRHIRRVRFESQMHVDPRNRKHVTVAFTIDRKFGEFLRTAHDWQVAQSESGSSASKPDPVKKTVTPKAAKSTKSVIELANEYVD